MEKLHEAINAVGVQRLADACKVSRVAVWRWKQKGLPWTEHTGKTGYAKIIEQMTDGKFKADELIKVSS